ncbi:flagellar hook-basal body complex protein FliE [Caloramator fervidus]|uniref:Flagellar hook-basal body complex protein FliE n=1 Tax=Caloramator fervidus TaxID=29344 RepID=A0A1H5SEZ0_9CLOT|nr:flagellar hook-basal body complex protein FliE [Caloramator fervidus]SEF48528.1 flagellar hook-basal body complex protein FliE [Caloramator fervidus]
MNINAVNLNDLTLQKTNLQNNIINFENYLKEALDKVNQKQVEAENATIDLITGEAEDIHSVLLKTEEARLSLELAAQIRNKLVEAYQEIMRIQI